MRLLMTNIQYLIFIRNAWQRLLIEQIFCERQLIFIEGCCIPYTDVTIVPRLIVEAGNVNRFTRVAQRKSIFMGIFKKPDSLWGFVEKGVELRVWGKALIDVIDQIIRSDIDRCPQLMLAVTRPG